MSLSFWVIKLEGKEEYLAPLGANVASPEDALKLLKSEAVKVAKNATKAQGRTYQALRYERP